MTALEKISLVPIAEYLAGEELTGVKHEYVGGTIHATAGGTNRHNAIAANTLVSLGTRLRGKPCRVFNSDTKVRIELPDHTRFYYPDAMVVCRSNPPEDHFQENPVVIIEILSDSTRRIDLEEKREVYLKMPSLKILLFVEPEAPLVLLHRRRAEGGFAAETISGPDRIIPLPEIGVELPLGELYEQIGT